MPWFHCNLVFYIGLKHFSVSQWTVFDKINVFLVNTVLGQVNVIANNMFFLKN